MEKIEPIAANDQLLGTAIDGKYHLDRIIGNGGMGAVYGGTHLQLDRQVAVKILRPDLMADPMMRARFEREALASARIEHPNAIRVYDFGTLDDLGTYLVMEYADGASLRQLIASRGPFHLDLAADLLCQAAAGLEAAHASGVIHRDVKPENMMVAFTPDGRPILKVVDFGIAKLLTTDGTTTQLTRPSDLIGTPRYMAPEQFTGEEIDTRVDVYALAVVLFEMLCGRAPFEGTFSEVIGKHIYAEPPTFASVGIEVPEVVERVVRRGLAKKREERPQSPLELATQFAEACGVEVANVGSSPLALVHHTPLPDVVFVDPSDDPTALGSTEVAGSPTLSEAATDESVSAFDATLPGLRETDDATVVRPSEARAARARDRIEVPLVPTPRRSIIERARSTGRLFVPPVLRHVWTVPAALALAGCAILGTAAYSDGARVDAKIDAVDAAAAASHVVADPAKARPTTAPSSASHGDQSEQAQAPEAPSVEATDPKVAESKPASREKAAPRKTPHDTTMRKVGRALRIDQHIRRLF